MHFNNKELQSSYNSNPSGCILSPMESEVKFKECNFMIFVPHEFSMDKTQIVRLLFIISAKDDFEQTFAKNYTSDLLETRNESTVTLQETPSVRRFSSSNSFYDRSQVSRRNVDLTRLSKLANLKKIDAHETMSPTHPVNATSNNTFIFSPQISNDGYLLFLQLGKNGKSYYLNIYHYTALIN